MSVTTQSATAAPIPAWKSLVAAFLAVIAFFIADTLLGMLVTLVIAPLGLDGSPLVIVCASTLAIVAAMAVARLAISSAVRRYSGRGVFLLFFALGLLAVFLALTTPVSGTVKFRQAMDGALVMASSYWIFWRRPEHR